MSEKTGKEDDALLLEYLIGEKRPKKNIEITSDDEDMLLLSSSSSTSYSSFPSSSSPVESKMKKIDSSPSAGSSGKSKTKSSPKVVELNSSTSNIIIEDSSDSAEEGLEDSNSNSVEVIDSEDELEEELDDESDSEESLAAYLDGKVEIFMAQGSFFIWNVEDIHMLREECRIVGKLVGCLPRAPRQNNQLGLPLQLMPEEAKLLEEIEAACIVEEIASHPDDITALRKTAFKSLREENYNIQKKLYKESRKEEVRQHKSVIIEGKKAKKRKIQELENKTKSESSKVSKSEKDHSSMSKSEQDNSSMSKSEDDSSMSKAEKDDCSLSKSDKDNSFMSKSDDQDCRNSESDSKMCDTLPEVSSNEDSIKTGAGNNSIKNAGGIDNDKYNDRKLDSTDNEMMTPKSKSDGVMSGEDKEIDDGGGDGDEQDNGSKDDCIIVKADDSVGKDDVEDDDEDFNVDEMVTEETHVKHSLIQLFTENPWKESVRRPKHWVYPLSQKELLRYEVFRDLWKKGYFLTSGSKFGGDYLVYPGDPARFHSHFIAICIDKTVDLSSLDIVSLGRLGSNVRKTVLLCAYNKSRQIVYTSLQWTGIR